MQVRTIFNAALGGLAWGAFSLGLPSQAAASFCGERSFMVNLLAQQNGETPQAVGLISTPARTVTIELLVSPNGNFTIMQTTPNGVSCVVASGNEWRVVKPAISSDPGF